MQYLVPLSKTTGPTVENRTYLQRSSRGVRPTQLTAIESKRAKKRSQQTTFHQKIAIHQHGFHASLISFRMQLTKFKRRKRHRVYKSVVDLIINQRARDRQFFGRIARFRKSEGHQPSFCVIIYAKQTLIALQRQYKFLNGLCIVLTGNKCEV